jgi:Tol biopolymer transport system component
MLVYQTGSVQVGSRLEICDRRGKRKWAVSERAEYIFPRLSLDGGRIASDIYDFQSHNNDIWIFDLKGGSKSRFTFAPSYENYPVWSPGGDAIMFTANPGGIYDIYRKPSTGAGGEDLLLKTPQNKITLDCSPDGRLLMYQVVVGPGTRSALWVLPLSKDGTDESRKPYPLMQNEFSEFDGRFSPDGRWVAYTSNESGRNEIYVRALSGGSGRWQVSIAGGNGPRWCRDGKELYYLSSDNTIMAAGIRLTEAAAEISNVHRLFEVPSLEQSVYPSFDAGPDGNTFLLNLQNDSQNQAPLTLVVNWDAALKN